MSSMIYQDRPGQRLPGNRLSAVHREHAESSGRAVRWLGMPQDGFLAWNTLRLTEFAGVVLGTHVPCGPRLIVVIHTYMPVLRLPALRCAACVNSRWPCQ